MIVVPGASLNGPAAISSLSSLEPPAAIQVPHWYAVHTRARHEKKVAAKLSCNGVDVFLPLQKQIRRWSDRRKLVELPLFPCYVLAHTCSSADFRLMLFKTSGILGLLGDHGYGTPIPDEELEPIRLILDHDLQVAQHPFLKIGQQVRVRGGTLDGLEGILVGTGRGRRLVLSVPALQRSISITLEGYDLEPV